MDFKRNYELEEKHRFVFDKQKLKSDLKEIYLNHKYSLSMEEVTRKIKGRFFSKTNWVNFKSHIIFSSFETNPKWYFDKKFNKYDENQKFKHDADWRYKRSFINSSFVFGFGTDSEGILFLHGYEYFLFDTNTKNIYHKIENSLFDYKKWSLITDENKFKNKELRSFFEKCKSLFISQYKKWEENTLKTLDQKEKSLNESKLNILSELDKDGNGEVDVVEGNDFNKLLKKHQKSIVEVDRTYVQQFVKVSSYIKTKKGNIQSIFNFIKDIPNQEVLNEYVEILKGEIHTYNLILFNSLNMIVSLVEDDMITFYEIHEMFDTLNMFDSKHEKDVSQKLTNIGDGLESLMYEIRDMGNKISNSIQELSYVTEESNRQLTNQLSEIDSTMKVGNLINTINTYQNYKNNKNTKSLRG